MATYATRRVFLPQQILSKSEETEAISRKLFENEATRGGSRPAVVAARGWVVAHAARKQQKRKQKKLRLGQKNSTPRELCDSFRVPPLSDIRYYRGYIRDMPGVHQGISTIIPPLFMHRREEDIPLIYRSYTPNILIVFSELVLF